MNGRTRTRQLVALGASAAIVGVGSIVGTGHAASAGTAVRVVKNVTYYSDPGAQLDEYLPGTTPKTPGPAIIFVHGGDWQSGDKTEWASDAQTVAGYGTPAFTINYDMTSHQDYVVEPRDVQAAVKWVQAHAKNFGIDPTRIGLVGDEAGGHLAMLAGTKVSGVKGVVSWSGPSDLPLISSDANCQAICPNNTTPVQWLGWDTQGFEGWTTYSKAQSQWESTSPDYQATNSTPAMLLYNGAAELVPVDQLCAMDSALGAGTRVEAHVIGASGGSCTETNVIYDHPEAPATSQGQGLSPYAWDNTLGWLQKTL